jgi:tetratricopeptide (TPR) repeat protein
MQFRLTRMVVLVAGLTVATSACGQYSISSIRSLKAHRDGANLYERGDFRGAAERFEQAVFHNPDFGFSYFYLANSYENLYRPARRGDPANDELLQKAATNYRLAIEKLATMDQEQAPAFRKRSYEYLVALYGADKLDNVAQAESVARELIAFEPNEPGNYQLLGRLYEEQGSYEQAEAEFMRAIEVRPDDPLGYQMLAGFYNRQGEFDKTMEAFQKRAELEPNNPEAWHTIATYYYKKVFEDTSVPRTVGRDYVLRGLEAEDKAIELNPEYFEALTFKNLLLRQQANLERDPAVQKKLLAEADQWRKRALEVQAKQGAVVPTGNN